MNETSVAQGIDVKNEEPGTSAARKLRVLYFTVTPLAPLGNGGSICCRNHVARLAEDPNIELFGIAAGPERWREGTEQFFAELGRPVSYLTFKNVDLKKLAIRSCGRTLFQQTFQFLWEMDSLGQDHIEDAIARTVQAERIDAIVIDYLPSALFLRLPRSDAKTLLISLNREGNFYEDIIRMGKTEHSAFTAGISLARARRWERRTYAAVDQVVTIGRPDLPQSGLRRPAVCITPYLDPKPVQWSYKASGRVFFVGAIGHYPNQLAIEWMVNRLAPEISALGADVKLTIVGAIPQDVPEARKYKNVEFLSFSDDATVAKLFTDSDMTLCPIENDYGVKFKSVEALSYGIPLFASRQTLLGLPQITPTPAIDLDQPKEAAQTLCALLANSDSLIDLARTQQREQMDFIVSQQGIWSKTLMKLFEDRRMAVK
jgi:hypothetical protein